MNTEQLLSLVRTVLKFGGGFLVSKGFAAGAEIEAAIGGVLAIVGIVLSWKKHVPPPQ